MRDVQTPSVSESISAMVDGELPLEAVHPVFETLTTQSEAQTAWYAYHVIGDVLRSPELAPRATEQAFWDRLQTRLAQEDQRELLEQVPLQAISQTVTAANVPRMHWRWAGLAAGVALVGLVALQWWGMSQPPAASMVVQAPTDAGVMIRDPQLDALLAAHQQMGGHSALQGPSGFLRNATYEGPQR